MFGRESRGLLNSEIAQCDIVSTIPLKTKYPSLNLAQSVMIYAYTLSHLTLGDPWRRKAPVDSAQLLVLKNKVILLMKAAGVKPNIFNRILERMGALGTGDVHLLHSLCRKLGEKIGEV